MKSAGVALGLIALGLFIAVSSARGKLGVLVACIFSPDQVSVTDES